VACRNKSWGFVSAFYYIIYFNAIWQIMFEKNSHEKDRFLSADMFLFGSFDYQEELIGQFYKVIYFIVS
jgi:hypothetical protein